MNYFFYFITSLDNGSMRNLFKLLIIFISVLWGQQASAESVDVLSQNSQPIGKKIQYLKEGGNPLSLDRAMQLAGAGEFTTSQKTSLSFGIGSAPVWLYFEASNASTATVLQRLSIETSWLDKLSVYFVREGELVKQRFAGDTIAFSEREINNLFFVFEHDFKPGNTDVYIRIETPDPMVLPVYLNSPDEFSSRHSFMDLSYGFLYGAILSLLAYNLMLFFSLKIKHYLLYAVYLFFFMLVNMSYSGHAYPWIWPDSVVWQQWSNPVLMMLFLVSGLIFATHFLNTKFRFPRLHKAVSYTCIVYVLFEILSVIANLQVAALILSFAFVFLFSITMVLLGAVSFYGGNQSAKYFLIASVSHVVATSITAMAVWGIIPYSTLAYRAIDIGMMIDVVLLAIALADQFRISQEARLTAEKLARIDPLTGINNRRAFYEYIKPIWSIAERKNYPMSVVMIDVDKFKVINDNYGHAVGDKALIKIAKILENDARSGDILARWGGEEFILFLPDTDMNEAVSIANRFREKISKTQMTDLTNPLNLTVSIGVSYHDSATMTLDELIKVADDCLYRAKSKGRDMVCAESLGIC